MLRVPGPGGKADMKEFLDASGSWNLKLCHDIRMALGSATTLIEQYQSVGAGFSLRRAGYGSRRLQPVACRLW
jgi:hypothetical protein